jgi:hypothetical protein
VAVAHLRCQQQEVEPLVEEVRQVVVALLVEEVEVVLQVEEAPQAHLDPLPC